MRPWIPVLRLTAHSASNPTKISPDSLRCSIILSSRVFTWKDDDSERTTEFGGKVSSSSEDGSGTGTMSFRSEGIADSSSGLSARGLSVKMASIGLWP